MDQKLKLLQTKLNNFNNIFIYECGLNGLLVNQLQTDLQSKSKLIGIIDHNLIIYQKFFNKIQNFNSSNFLLQFPAFQTKTITTQIYKKTNFDLIISVLLYQNQCYVCVNLFGLHYYESEFKLVVNEEYAGRKIYQAYSIILEFIIQTISLL